MIFIYGSGARSKLIIKLIRDLKIKKKDLISISEMLGLTILTSHRRQSLFNNLHKNYGQKYFIYFIIISSYYWIFARI